jgi:hypothetical protein
MAGKAMISRDLVTVALSRRSVARNVAFLRARGIHHANVSGDAAGTPGCEKGVGRGQPLHAWGVPAPVIDWPLWGRVGEVRRRWAHGNPAHSSSTGGVAP